MFGASRSVAGSHLINLRRQRASLKSRDSVMSSTLDDHTNIKDHSETRQYIIPNFARFEFCPKVHQSKDNTQVNEIENTFLSF